MAIAGTNITSEMGSNESSQKRQEVYVIKVGDIGMKLEGKEQEKYNPLEHGEAKHPTTYLDTLVHLFKGIVGTGILSLPAAFAQSGYVVGPIGVILSTYFSTYCGHILARSEVELCRRRKIPALSYQATAEAAVLDGPSIFKPLAPIALHFCNFLLLLGQITSACVYILFIAANVKAVTDVYVGVIDVRLMMLMCAVPLLLVSSIRRLKYLAPFSTIGSLTVIVSCAVVFYFMFQDVPPLASRRPTGPLQELPRFLGTVFFATGCVSLILPLQNEMKSPSKFTSPMGVLNVGSVVVVILYVLFGFFGYLKFGDEAAGSITLNLPDNISAHMVQLMLAVATLFGTTLSYYVAVTIIMENYLCTTAKEHLVIYEYVIRVALVLITVIVAEVVPNLEVLVSLSGVVSHCILSTTLPCIIHIFTHYKKGSTLPKFLFCFGQDLLIILVTTIIFVTGLATNLERVFALYR